MIRYERCSSAGQRCAWSIRFFFCLGMILIDPSSALADFFSEYSPAAAFQLPAGATTYDVGPDGRIVAMAGANVFLESASGSRSFAQLGTPAGGDFSSFGPGFVRVSPNGTTLAIGNGGGVSFSNYQVGVFDLATLGGDWINASHFDGTWLDDTNLALTAGVFGQPSFVSLLDTTSSDLANPINPVIVNNIGGASGGIAFDSTGNLYTANGFATTGPSETGAVNLFDNAAWLSAMNTANPLDFETEGVTVVDVLSGASLGFDSEGNLFVGGGEFGGPDVNFSALIRESAILDAMAGLGAADILDTNAVRRFDPDPLSDFNTYDVGFNPVTSELYLRDGDTVFPFLVPEPATGLLGLFGLFLVLRRRRNSNETTSRYAGSSLTSIAKRANR